MWSDTFLICVAWEDSEAQREGIDEQTERAKKTDGRIGRHRQAGRHTENESIG